MRFRGNQRALKKLKLI